MMDSYKKQNANPSQYTLQSDLADIQILAERLVYTLTKSTDSPRTP